MNNSEPQKPSIIQFTADDWEHVCPIIRAIGPADLAGWQLIRGSEWEESAFKVYPERIINADIVLIQRDFSHYASAYQEVYDQARKLGKVIVYEIDDLLTELPEVHPDVHHYMHARPAMLRAMANADAVVCSTTEIQEYAHQFNSNVHVIPNYLNDLLWTVPSQQDISKRIGRRPLVIGYLGSHSHLPDLDMIAPVLESILERYSGEILLRLWGISPPQTLAGRPDVEWLDLGMVSYAEFASYFSRQECDIFIATLLDNLFNRSKSAIKFLE